MFTKRKQAKAVEAALAGEVHGNRLTFLERLSYGYHDMTKPRWRLSLRELWIVGSFVFGYRISCFGCRELRATWDPIVGAYCEKCQG